jgi:hypothetical protein
MRDINEIMPKIPHMRWGALMNKTPTSKKVKEMNRIFPHDGRWHTVFEEEEQVFVDGMRIWKKEPKNGRNIRTLNSSNCHRSNF